MAFILGSCAFVRHHSSRSLTPDRKINRVAVFIVVEGNTSYLGSEQHRLAATRAVAEELSELHAFKFKILERDLPVNVIDKMDDKSLDLELRANYDAYMIVVTEFNFNTKATVELRLTGSSALLIEARQAIYDTELEEVVRGSMVLFAKEWKDMYGSLN